MGKRAAAVVETHLETPKKRIKFDGPVIHSPVPEQTFVLNESIVDGAIMTDIKKNKWRVGKPFGKSGMGYFESDRKADLPGEDDNFKRSKM